MRRTKNLVLLLTAVAVFAFVDMAAAELYNFDLPDRTGIRVWNTRSKAHAAFRVEEQLDTNIFLDNTDRKFDSITVASPSVGVEVPLGRDCVVSADYEVDFNMYGTYNAENHMDQTARLLLEYELADYVITVKDTFDIFTNRAENEDSQRIRQNNNYLKASVSSVYKRFGFEVSYENSLDTYGSEDFIVPGIQYDFKDNMDQDVALVLSYRVWPKTTVFVKDTLGYADHLNTSLVPNYWYNETDVGVRGEWFRKTEVDAFAGFRYQGYDKVTSSMASNDFAGFVCGGGASYHPTDDDDVAVAILRTVYESTYSTMNYYIANLVSCAYRHRFNDKLYAGVYGGYQLHQYPSQTTENGVTAKRYDNYYIAGCNVVYNIRKWVSVEARYDFRNRVSRFDLFDYFQNVVSFRGTVGF